LLALLVLHRAKLLASTQSILALGVAPRQVAGTPVPVFTPFPGERGQGDRDNKSEVYFKNRLFLQPEATASAVAFSCPPTKNHLFFPTPLSFTPFRYGLFVKNVL